MELPPRRSDRLTGLGIAGSFVIAAAAITRPWAPLREWGLDSGDTIYPWWLGVLLATGAACGCVALAAPAGLRGRGRRVVAAGAALVVGAEVAGTGVVAAKHWRPAQGMGGYPGDTDRLELLAVVVAAAGATATGLALRQLVADAAFRRPVGRSAAVGAVALGLGIVVALPPLMLDPADFTPVTSWGAVGLIYAGPWGLAVALSAWLARPAADAVRWAVLGCAVLAAIGPQMADLLLADERRFALVAVAVGVLAVAAGRRPAAAP